MNTRGEQAGCGPAHPPPETRRKVRGSQSRKGAISAPERHPLPTASRLPVANQDFLGLWMVDIQREGHSQRSAPQKRNRAHLRRCTHCTPIKPSNWDGGGDKTHPPPSRGDCVLQATGHLSCLDLGRAQNRGPTKSAPLWSTQEPEPEWLRPGNCMQPRPTSNSSWQSNLEPEQCRLGKHTHHELGEAQCG